MIMLTCTKTCLICMAMLCLIIPGCDRSGETGIHEEHDHDVEAAAARTNRIAIPPSVRRNLGISFVNVERRRVEKTLRVPGQFEYLPTARREYRTPVPGRIELLVEQFEKVDAGTPLFRIDSPAWREMQQQLADVETQISRLTARLANFEPLLAAHEEHDASLHESVAVWRERLAQLESLREAGGGRTDEIAKAKSSLANARAELASTHEKKAHLRAERHQTEADLTAARARMQYLVRMAAAFVPYDRDELLKEVETEHGHDPRWATIDAVEIRAEEHGIVEELALTKGTWASESANVLSMAQPERLRFRASGLQSDLGVLRDGLPARIVPPTPTAAGRAVPIDQTMPGTLSLGLVGDPRNRTVDLYVVPELLLDWARPGVTAHLEIVTDPAAAISLAVPRAAVQRDGLTPVLFRRAPDNPNEAIRIEADLGKDDGRWVEVLSGLRDGDEVVLDGAFQLMLATSGTMQRGGHFHADGTFHEGEH